MPLYYWLNLLGFVSLLALLGLFINSMERDVPNDSSCQTSSNANFSLPHPFLCGQKMNIHEAQIADLASIEGVSESLAQEIFLFLKKHPSAKLEMLDDIQGVGPKTIEHLRTFFTDASEEAL